MRRSILTAVVVINLLLLGGWAAFELLVTESPSPSPPAEDGDPSRSSAVAGGPLESPAATAPASRESVDREDAGEPSSRLFDWRRRPAATDARPPSGKPAETTPLPSARDDSPSAERVARAPRPAPANPGGTRPIPAMPTPSRTATSPPRTIPQTDGVDEPSDPSEDREPPKLDWLRFTPPTVAAGEEAILSASASDDLAGVRNVVGRISSPSGNAHLGFALAHDDASGAWQSVIRVPEKAESGRWQVTWFRITDKANNSRDERWSPGQSPAGSTLMVSSTDGDSEPPVLHAVSLDRATMSSSEPVHALIDVRDERSGVRFVSGTFQSPSGKAWAPFTAEKKGSPWSGAVLIPENGECGEWTLRRITAIDEANNQATWGAGDERIRGISFYRSFSDGSCDSDPPELIRVELDPRHVSNEADSTIQVTAWIDDLASGVATASGFAMATGAESPQRVHFALRKEGEGPGAVWTGTLTVPRHSMTGRWEIRALRVSDEARNQRTYSVSDPVMSAAWFIVD